MTQETNNTQQNQNEAVATHLQPPVEALSEVLPDDAYEYASSGNNDVNEAASNVENIRQGFKVGELNLMIGYADGSQLIDIPSIHHVPNVQPWFLGVINLHGVVIPAFNLANYLNINEVSSNSQRLLVLEHGNNAAAIIVENLPQRLRWNTSQAVEKNTAPKTLLPHLSSACLIGEELWFDLDISSLLQALEDALK